MYHKGSMLFGICILSVIPQVSFANSNMYTLTESSQGISELFENQSSNAMSGQDELKTFKLKEITTHEGNVEYRFIPVVVSKPSHKWIEAEGVYSIDSSDTQKNCSELDSFGATWRAPTATEIQAALSYDTDLRAIIEKLPGDDIIKGYVDMGEWYYIRSNHTGGAIDKNMGDGDPRPTICYLDM
ncbi:TPA: hypothetical protein ACX6QH_000077 [Photobacterium damselae]|uniref:hypothetical protein n=1 Tax=Photobacterium damselae TaxID=38293 RepID=UPI001F1B8FD7|nr:hypothetical protein [Photobacterium damselae]UKA08571.1 hypothetical protein IHC90_16285 [Photobacterium damselae subsp. damselae]UKA11848.1 hypothetical protein IHC91_18890 [Photobacterium damselae subsp. damselae]UKA23036.1 hypothetical protein IHC92_18895 [Photobacterium damselae subsp. damselae]UKA31524.1 hypothetical protein IPQ37_16855 [Photobacterium damselae subsp. damselae]